MSVWLGRCVTVTGGRLEEGAGGDKVTFGCLGEEALS